MNGTIYSKTDYWTSGSWTRKIQIADLEAHRKKGYDYDDYLREYRRFRDALRKVLPGMPLAGPDVADATSWVTRFARDEGKNIKLLTHHYYRSSQLVRRSETA